MKYIVISCDGTWDDDAEHESITNVKKFCLLLTDSNHEGARQESRYVKGVGAGQSGWKKWWEGATGEGLNKLLLEAYCHVVELYNPGDRLCFVGFSRGAYTARSLAGLIRNAGVVRRDSAADAAQRALKLYRSRAGEDEPWRQRAMAFRAAHSVEDETPIHFLGVWDTVGALGIPLFRHAASNVRFHDTDLSRIVKCAYQAIAIDELRRPFQPAIWYQSKEARDAGQVLEQRWFAGVHRDVGGGEARTGLSDLALIWMLERATDAGLAFRTPAECKPAFAFAPDSLADAHDSMTLFYRLMGRIWRIIDDPAALAERKREALAARPPYEIAGTSETLQPSVRDRLRSRPDWNPNNLADYLRRHP